MSTIPGNRESARAFTILELLIVITIIGILAGILLPVLNQVKKTAMKASAKNDAVGLVNAINSYKTEYGRYPLSEIGSEDPVDPIKTDQEFMQILLAEEKVEEGEESLNPRGIQYFEGKAQARRGGHGLDEDGNYYDPWGNFYEIYIDGNYDNRITYLNKELRKGVIARSWGPDGKPEVAEDEGKTDDVKTW